ncbi:RNA polymerase sigma factor [Ferruginibacter sp.]
MNVIEEIKKGEVNAFTAVYNLYHVKLYRYFLKKTKDPETTKELVQLSFIKLWNSKHTLSDNFPFDNQLFVIAKTTFIDFIRQDALKKSRSAVLEEDTAEWLQTSPDSSFEEADYFDKVITALPPVRKKIFIMSRSKGLNYKEIANELSISINTVEDHMSKALRYLKTIASIFF